jgi:hypothetical protein
MKRLLSLAVCLLSTTMLDASSVAGQNRQGEARARDRFVGAWRLVALEERGSDGKSHRCDCAGLFVFTHDGHASVQVMTRDPHAAVAGAGQYSQGGYEASFGGYVVDERAHTFTFHIEGAVARNLIGKDLPRLYQFSGTQLTVRPTSPDEHWTVTWERY